MKIRRRINDRKNKHPIYWGLLVLTPVYIFLKTTGIAEFNELEWIWFTLIPLSILYSFFYITFKKE